MRYKTDYTPRFAQIGDLVSTPAGRGRVVVLVNSRQTAPNYNIADWESLKTGAVVATYNGDIYFDTFENGVRFLGR